MTQRPREMVAVMFTDLRGYSAITQRDEHLALDIVDSMNGIADSVIKNHAGKIIKRTGDGLMVEFGSALAAAQCAVELQKQLSDYNSTSPRERRIIIRVGIHSGDVVRGGPDTTDLFGNTVNIAARVEPRAPAGGIAITESVYHQIKSTLGIPIKRLGTFSLKGIGGKLPLYQIMLPTQFDSDSGSILSTIKLKSKFPSKLYGVATIAILLLAISFLVFRRIDQENVFPASIGIQEKSIAVMPFENMSGDKSNVYFANGMQEEILTLLTQVGGLKVISHESTKSYASEPDNLNEIAKILDVENVLEGSVQKAGNKVLINVRLINVATNSHIWANSYERTINDIFGVESEVAKEVASALKVKLAPSEAKRLETIPTSNPKAHDLYLQAYALNNRTDEHDQEKALTLLNQAVKEDPNYAAAWALMADSELALGDVYHPPHEIIPKARRAALEAVSSDANLAAAHSELGALEYYYDWDFPAAHKELSKAVELDPGSADARLLFADYLAEHEGDYVAAEKQLDRARSIDPLDPWIPYYESVATLVAGQYPKALNLAQETLILDPGFYYDWDPLAHVYAAMHEYKQCEERYEAVIKNVARAATSYEYAACSIKAGDVKRGRMILSKLEFKSKHGYVDGTYLAAVYVALDEKDRAFLMLKKALADRSAYLSTITQNFWFESIKSDQRFSELLSAMKTSAIQESFHNRKT